MKESLSNRFHGWIDSSVNRIFSEIFFNGDKDILFVHKSNPFFILKTKEML